MEAATAAEAVRAALGGGSDARGGGKMAVEDPRGSRNGTGFGRRKVCRYCADKTAKVDFKDAGALKYFLTERGKIIPRRISGNCATHQREVARAIKRSRQIALLPYTVING